MVVRHRGNVALGGTGVQRSGLLLVDGELRITAAVADALLRAGFEVTTVQGTAEALERVRVGTFALAIIDLGISGSTALALARELGSLGQPFMVLTASMDEESIRNAIDAGAIACITTPLDSRQLVPAVWTAVRRAQDLAAAMRRTDRLSAALKVNSEISVAIGLLMAHRGLSRDLAFETLRQQARRACQKVEDLAASVIAGAEALYSMPVAAGTNLPTAASHRKAGGAGADHIR